MQVLAYLTQLEPMRPANVEYFVFKRACSAAASILEWGYQPLYMYTTKHQFYAAQVAEAYG
jgi:hypothetical protein